MNKGLFVSIFLFGCIMSHTSMSETIAYFERGKLYVYDPSYSSDRKEVDDGTSDFQVGHHAVAFINTRKKNKLYFASAATKWEKVGVDRKVVFYKLIHDTLVWKTDNGEVYRISSLTNAAKAVKIGDSKRISTILAYDDGSP